MAHGPSLDRFRTAQCNPSQHTAHPSSARSRFCCSAAVATHRRGYGPPPEPRRRGLATSARVANSPSVVCVFVFVCVCVRVHCLCARDPRSAIGAGILAVQRRTERALHEAQSNLDGAFTGDLQGLPPIREQGGERSCDGDDLDGMTW